MTGPSPSMPPEPIDPHATPATRALHAGLHALTGQRTLFGHQDDLAFGRAWSGGHTGRSDVRDITGKLPGVIGFDVGGIELLAGHNLDGAAFPDLIRWIREAHAAGAVVTLSWHSVNPITNGGYGHNTAPLSAASVLPGGREHEKYVKWLNHFAMFDEQLTDAQGAAIPIVFRPFHEHTGDWFWWGTGSAAQPSYTDPADFRALWQFTVEYLSDVAGLHNLLYAISPDRSRIRLDAFEEDYLRGYPGDDFVDVFGIDDYWDTGRRDDVADPDVLFADYVATLEATARLAGEHGKLAAQTETGTAGEGTGHPDDPWTGFLAAAAEHSELTRRHLWHLLWRNAGDDERLGTPAAGGTTADDLAALAGDPFFAFAGDAPDLYSLES